MKLHLIEYLRKHVIQIYPFIKMDERINKISKEFAKKNNRPQPLPFTNIHSRVLEAILAISNIEQEYMSKKGYSLKKRRKKRIRFSMNMLCKYMLIVSKSKMPTNANIHFALKSLNNAGVISIGWGGINNTIMIKEYSRCVPKHKRHYKYTCEVSKEIKKHWKWQR